jgi:succinylglutamate desuccinylase
MSKLIRRVAIVGGTHGNELTGIYLVKKFDRFPELLDRPSLECTTLLANPPAIAANRRYIDRDLNRCFADVDLANPDLTSYEAQRAQEIATQFGPKTDSRIDFIIDLHSSTANMGLTILLSSLDPFNLRLAAYMSQVHPAVRVCSSLSCDQSAPMLRSLSPLGCTIEVGAIAQGILDANLLQQTEMLVHSILNYLDAANQGVPSPVPASLALYQTIDSIDYPRDAAGELTAAIHPQLQFRDYEPLVPGAPMFLSFTGESIGYGGASIVYPIFINEAAYYEKGIAMSLTVKQEILL